MLQLDCSVYIIYLQLCVRKPVVSSLKVSSTTREMSALSSRVSSSLLWDSAQPMPISVGINQNISLWKSVLSVVRSVRLPASLPTWWLLCHSFLSKYTATLLVVP